MKAFRLSLVLMAVVVAFSYPKATSALVANAADQRQ